MTENEILESKGEEERDTKEGLSYTEVAFQFSSVQSLSRVRLLATP